MTESPTQRTQKSKSKPKAKKAKTVASHPKVSEMVNSAIKDLKDRGGSSLQAIKKYIASNYKVDAEKLAPFIRKYLKSSVVSGGLVQTKGKGASGSFRMGGAKATGAAKKTPKKAPKKAKKTAAKPKAAQPASTVKKETKTPAKSKPKTTAAKKPKPVVKIAPKKTKPAKKAAKKPAKASPKKKPAAKKAKAKK